MEQRITKRGLHCRFENYDKRVKFREREREDLKREDRFERGLRIEWDNIYSGFSWGWLIRSCEIRKP